MKLVHLPLSLQLVLAGLVLAARRDRVRIIGTTVAPGFSRRENDVAAKCPAEYPFNANNHQYCCKYELKTLNLTYNPDCDGYRIKESDSVKCCQDEEYIKCPGDKCRSHWRGLLKSYPFMVSEKASLDIAFHLLEPEVYPDFEIPLPSGLYTVMLMPFKEKIVACGTKDPSTYVRKYECAIYDPYMTKDWDYTFGNWNENRFASAWAYISDVLHVFGGEEFLQGLYYNEALNEWLRSSYTLPTDPYGSFVKFLTIVEYKTNELYLFGGEISTGSRIDDVVKFTPTDGFTKHSKMTMPMSYPGAAVYYYQGKKQIIVAGVKTDAAFDMTVHIFDPVANTWTHDAAWNIPGTPMAAFPGAWTVYNNKFILFGGVNGLYNTRTLEFQGHGVTPAWKEVRPLSSAVRYLGAIRFSLKEPKGWVMNPDAMDARNDLL